MASDAWPEAFEMPGKATAMASTKCNKPLGRPGLRRGPRWGSLQRSPYPVAGGEGLAASSPRTAPLLSAFQASGCLSGLGLRPFGSRLSLSPNFQTPSEVKSYIRPWCRLWTKVQVVVRRCNYENNRTLRRDFWVWPQTKFGSRQSIYFWRLRNSMATLRANISGKEHERDNR